MDKPTLTFKSEVPKGAVLTYAFTDSTPGKKPTKISLAHDGTMEHSCGNEVPPWKVACYVNEDGQTGRVLFQDQFEVPQADSTITVKYGYYSTSTIPGYYSTVASSSSSSPSSDAAAPSSLPQAGASAVSAEPAAGFSAAQADAASTIVAPQPSLQHELQHEINYVQQAQSQTQWCWAAVASSVAAFYGPPDPDSSQCQLACWATTATTCCTDGSSSACNRPQQASRALRHVGHLGRSFSGRLEFHEIRREIDANRPIAATISWRGGGAHVVVITGYTAQGRPSVTVNDPSGAVTTHVALDEFPHGGTWTWTNTTRA